MKLSQGLVSVALMIGQPLLLNAISIPATAYIIRGLGPIGYGQWMVATSLAAAMAFIANLGLRTLFVRAIAQYPENVETALGEQLGLRFLLSCLAGLLTALLCRILNYPAIVLSCVIVTTLGATCAALSSALGDVLQGFGQFKTFAFINFVTGLVVTVVSVIAIWRGADALGLALAYLSAPVTGLIILALIVQKRHCRVRILWDFARYGALLHATRAQGAQQFLGAVQDRIEQFLLPKLVGIATFGYFAASSILPGRLLIVPDSLATFYYPTIARYSNKDEEQATQYVTQLLWLSLLACIPIAILVFYLAPYIAAILFRSKPHICSDIIRVTIWSVPLVAIQYALNSALQAAGRIRQTAHSTALAAILNMVIAAFLVSRWGLQGACWSWLLRPVLISALLFPAFYRLFPNAVKSMPISPILLASLLMAAPLYLCAMQPRSAPIIVGGGAVAILLYAACLVLMQVPQTVRRTLRGADTGENT